MKLIIRVLRGRCQQVRLIQTMYFHKVGPNFATILAFKKMIYWFLKKLNDVMFGLTVYRDEVEIRLSKKVESDDDDDDDVIQISRADYDKALLEVRIY